MKKRRLYLYEYYDTFVLARNKLHAIYLLFCHDWDGKSLKRVKRKYVYLIGGDDQEFRLPMSELKKDFEGKPGVIEFPER